MSRWIKKIRLVSHWGREKIWTCITVHEWIHAGECHHSHRPGMQNNPAIRSKLTQNPQSHDITTTYRATYLQLTITVYERQVSMSNQPWQNLFDELICIMKISVCETNVQTILMRSEPGFHINKCVMWCSRLQTIILTVYHSISLTKPNPSLLWCTLGETEHFKKAR